jgi:hypothetical protein
MRFFLAVIRLASSFSGDTFHTANVWGAQLGRVVAMSLIGHPAKLLRLNDARKLAPSQLQVSPKPFLRHSARRVREIRQAEEQQQPSGKCQRLS